MGEGLERAEFEDAAPKEELLAAGDAICRCMLAG
jgi:hypothetical protein